MTTSTTRAKNKLRLWPILFWIAVWQVASMIIGEQILLCSPIDVVKRLFVLVRELSFWSTVFNSFSHIVAGFLLALLFGCLFAFLATKLHLLRELLAPLVAVIKATPVASFIILTLVFIGTKNLSIFISFLMVFPIIYLGVCEGIDSTDGKLLELATVFRLRESKRLRYITLPETAPFLRSACAAALGLCWKAGVAAEVIGIPKGTIGENLYNAKIYLDTPDLFAWTVVIILISLLFERAFNFVTKKLLQGVK